MAPKMMKPTMTSAHTSGIFADMTVDGPEIGDLVVVIDRARNLPNLKTMGKQDPYCAARLGKEAKKTGTDRRGGQTPRWDQELRFTVHDSPDYYKLKVSVFNDDRKTDLIGETWVDLKQVVVRGGGQNDGWHSLNCRGRAAGELRMEITYYDTRERQEKPIEEKVSRRVRESDSQAALKSKNVKRRPLPQGPSHRASMPPESLLPSSRRSQPDSRLTRFASTDVVEEGSLDPYEHKHKMMSVHGFPFDPSKPYRKEQLAYNGGPRPAPGQQGFTDLEKLSYRNRGLQLPEKPAQEEPEPSSVPDEQPQLQNQCRPSVNSNAIPEQHDDVRVLRPTHSSHEIIQQPAEAQIVHQQYQTPDHDAIREHHDMYGQPAAHAPYYQGFEEPSNAYYSETPNYISSQPAYTESLQFTQPPLGEEDEGPPPPPPPHRSAVEPQRPASSFMTPTQYDHVQLPERTPPMHPEPSVYYQQPEVMNNYPVQSVPQFPPSVHQSFENDGRYQHFETAGYDVQRNLPRHQVSAQDMRSFPAEYHTHQSFDQNVGDQQYHTHTDTRLERSFHQPGYETPYHQLYSEGPPFERSEDNFSGNHLRKTSQALVLAGQISNMQHENDNLHDVNPSPSFDENVKSFTHSSTPPLIKPRAISPNRAPYEINHAAPEHTASQIRYARKSVSPAPPPTRRPSSPRLSGVAFSPDSFDVLNPRVSSGQLRASNEDEVARQDFESVTRNSQVPAPTVEDAIDPDAPIRDSFGKVIDPSDHLPSSTWAPEPEPRKAMKPTEPKLRFMGAVPMPAPSPRPTRPEVELPELKSNTRLPEEEKADTNGTEKEKSGRNRLQKRVRVMMTNGARKLETEESRGSRANQEADTMPLRDLPNANSYTSRQTAREAREREVYGRNYEVYGRDYEVYGKSYGGRNSTPSEKLSILPGQEENGAFFPDTAVTGMDALSRELNGIDLGNGAGRVKRTRFAVTLM